MATRYSTPDIAPTRFEGTHTVDCAEELVAARNLVAPRHVLPAWIHPKSLFDLCSRNSAFSTRSVLSLAGRVLLAAHTTGVRETDSATPTPDPPAREPEADRPIGYGACVFAARLSFGSGFGLADRVAFAALTLALSAALRSGTGSDLRGGRFSM